MTELQAIKKSIRHWERMIEWAKKQEPEEKPSLIRMERAIKEGWLADFCALCDLFIGTSLSCLPCPLSKKYGNCKVAGKGKTKENVWSKVGWAFTWSDWLKHARVMLKQLESLLPERGD